MHTNYKLNGTEHRVLAYVAELELEVDRLRKHAQLLYEDAAKGVHGIVQLYHSGGVPPETLREVEAAGRKALEGLRALRVPPGYHPSHDQVVDIALQPLVERVFRWQQRLTGVDSAVLHFELQENHLEWFPARLSHILDNLLANALEYCDPNKGEVRVTVGFCERAAAYELRVSDNGLGIADRERPALLDLSRRVTLQTPRRLGVGLATVQLLVEESGGSLAIQSHEGTGTSIIVTLPRYDLDDFLTKNEQPAGQND